jgi:hypothetical protein
LEVLSIFFLIGKGITGFGEGLGKRIEKRFLKVKGACVSFNGPMAVKWSGEVLAG